MSRFSFQLNLALPLALIFLCASAFCISAVEVNPAKESLVRLMQGNQRYVASQTVCHEDWTAKRSALLEGQKPFAVIVACSDSRVPPEIVFDQSLGALFIVRVAGNIVDDFAVGSIEYDVDILGANLALVPGHSNGSGIEQTIGSTLLSICKVLHRKIIMERFDQVCC